jgi:hypothetical protein
MQRICGLDSLKVHRTRSWQRYPLPGASDREQLPATLRHWRGRAGRTVSCSAAHGRITRGQCEDDMEVGHGQQLGGKRGQPLGACVALALGTVPVATRVIGDGLMAAAKTLIVMTTQSCGAATDDSVHHLAVLPGLVRSLPFPGARARCTEDVGHLKGGPSHLFTRLLECLTSSVLDTSRASSGLRPLADDAWTNAGTPSCRRAWHVRAGAGWYGDRRRLRAYASRSCDGACEARRALRCRSDSGPGDRIRDGHIRPPVVLHAWE